MTNVNQDSTNGITLLSCPFCGGEAKFQIFDSMCNVVCENCHIGTRYESIESYEQVIAAWNARAERTCRNVHEEWEKTSFAGAETSFCCSECGAHYFDAESYYAGLADADGDSIRTNFCPNCGSRVIE